MPVKRAKKVAVKKQNLPVRIFEKCEFLKKFHGQMSKNYILATETENFPTVKILSKVSVKWKSGCEKSSHKNNFLPVKKSKNSPKMTFTGTFDFFLGKKKPLPLRTLTFQESSKSFSQIFQITANLIIIN